MVLSMVILQQTLTMFLYMAAGYLLSRSGKLSQHGTKDLAALLLWLVIPSVLINSFCIPFSPEKLKELVLSSLLGLLALLLSMAVSWLLFSKDPIENLAAAFSNAGFIGIPLVRQSLGDNAVFFLVGIVAALNIFQWFYGLTLLDTGKKKGSWAVIWKSPVVIGTLLGLALFLSGAGEHIPGTVRGALSGLAATNSPLATVVLGSYLAQTKLSSLVVAPRLYLLSCIRLILIPLLTLAVLWPIPIPGTMKLAILIAASAPVGANAAVYAQLYDRNYPYACQMVAQSTVLSIATLPLLATLGQSILL